MQVISTRGANSSVSALEGVLKGIAPDGGLYVPKEFPQLNLNELLQSAKESYDALACDVMHLFFEEIPLCDLHGILKKSYAGFDVPQVAPLTELTPKEYILELTHGPTLAFKDMALQVLPRLILAALKICKVDDDILILTATSGDTGKAALEGFKNVSRTSIIVFYPVDGVSIMQKLQMVTQDGNNTGVFGVDGNFDDAQSGVKKLFSDSDFNIKVQEFGFKLSSANSINIGRLVPQIAYYVNSYLKLVLLNKIKIGEKINFCIPTGNFGNILAAYYAMNMGIPINRLICASNQNNVLTDFFNEGKYNSGRMFYKTISPSMDILLSSNLERLLFEVANRDSKIVSNWMDELKKVGKYDIGELRHNLDKIFYADFCNENETREIIKDVYNKYGYLIDPHTAVAQGAYQKYIAKTNDPSITITVATANPYKFTQDVYMALSSEWIGDAFEAAEKLHEITKTEIPKQIKDLHSKPILHDKAFAKNELENAVFEFLRGSKFA